MTISEHDSEHDLLFLKTINMLGDVLGEGFSQPVCVQVLVYFFTQYDKHLGSGLVKYFHQLL